MNLFRKNRDENWIIKLFKITDDKNAEQFDMENCILSTIDFINQKTDLKASDFDINYSNSRKTLSGFKTALKNQKEIVYSFVGFDSNNSNTYFTISNPMLNYTEKPKNSKIDICIQISSEYVESENIEEIAGKLIKTYDFEYGYITQLPSNFDSNSERKIKKGLFSTKTEVNKTDLTWTFHSVGILEGFIKSLYPVNYLNKSHFADLITKEMILENGITENISENIIKWALSSEEIDRLKNIDQIRKISIITDDLGFLKTEKANVLHKKMELKKASC